MAVTFPTTENRRHIGVHADLASPTREDVTVEQAIGICVADMKRALQSGEVDFSQVERVELVCFLKED